MARKKKKALAPDSDQVHELFSQVDETGHSNASNAARQHRHRKERGTALDIDPLSEDDPSGSNVGKVIAKTAVAFVVIVLAVVVLAQVSCGVARRANTADLSSDVNVRTVTSALKGGVEWGNGFTQFPEDFTVQEADESTGRIEVSVVDTSSKDEMECLAGSQIQATALAINALLNPNITTVVYHVSVHVDDNGDFQQSALFGFLKPTGRLKSFMTFIWTKNTTSSGGFNLNCNITGMDSDTASSLRDKVTALSDNPILSAFGSSTTSSTTDASTTDAAADTATTESSAADTSTAGVTVTVDGATTEAASSSQ
ncbi:MAG: hypothetical protein LKI25_05375 [Atopobiaceae bacterium]|jgi:hypothetical protein|nr:hypothetical protein [Atopobiaceae bacterium]MCI2173634.1 hypothetical protein [Atopobiaceae bacterium]MCI2207724.1 hypothetical protein [Atopobiaceae bacterium]